MIVLLACLEVMAQKNILPQIQEMHKSPTGGYRSVR